MNIDQSSLSCPACGHSLQIVEAPNGAALEHAYGGDCAESFQGMDVNEAIETYWREIRERGQERKRADAAKSQAKNKRADQRDMARTGQSDAPSHATIRSVSSERGRTIPKAGPDGGAGVVQG